MSQVQFPRFTPSLTHLEDRCTPALLTVTDNSWNPATIGSLPYRINEANSPAYPGLDVIEFSFAAAALGPNPIITATNTVDVTEGVKIIGTNGNNFVTIDGTQPLDFTHAGPAAVPLGELPATESIIDRVMFKNCTAAVGFHGGAVRVTGGTLTLQTARFENNSSGSVGGAIYVGPDGTLVKGNKAPNFDGGAIENRGTVVLKRAWFIDNTAGRNGGAIHVDDDGVLNAPTLPGVEGWVNPDVQILANTATNGGGVAYRSTAMSDLNGVIFGYNQATAEGGGMWVKSGTVNSVGGTVAGNSAVTGQGMFVACANPMDVATVNADGVSFFGNVTPLGAKANPAEIGDNGRLNTSGCFFNTGGPPVVIPGTNGQWTSSGDTP